MDFKWLVVVLLNGFIFVYCSDCGTDKLQYLAKIEIAWEDYEKELVQRGLGSLIHPYYVLTAGTFVVDYYQFHSDDRKYPSMTVEFPNSDYASGFTFKVQEVIIIPHIYNPRSTDFALIKLEERPKFSPAYLRALYKNKQITLSTSKQYYLGTLTGIMNITPTDPDSILILSIIDTTSEDDYLVFDDKIGAPLLFCDQTRDHYVQAGIYSIVNTTSAHQRNTNLLMLTEHIYEYIAEQSFSKCYAKQRINDGESRFHNRAHLGDGVVHIYATVYSAEGKPRQRRCSGSFFSEEAIYTSATCLKDYVAERNKHQVSPELYETYNNMTYKMVVEVGFKDEVHHPHTIITEKNIKQITLDPNYNPESGASDTAFVAFNKRISDFIDTDEQFQVTPALKDGVIEDFDGEILMFVGIDRKGNSTRHDTIGSALFRVDQALCKDLKNADICMTSEFISPWRTPQNINIGGTFFVCDTDNRFKQIALLAGQSGYVSRGIWLPNYNITGET